MKHLKTFKQISETAVHAIIAKKYADDKEKLDNDDEENHDFIERNKKSRKKREDIKDDDEENNDYLNHIRELQKGKTRKKPR